MRGRLPLASRVCLKLDRLLVVKRAAVVFLLFFLILQEKTMKNFPNALDEALAEIENGETVKCDDFEDFVNKIND